MSYHVGFWETVWFGSIAATLVAIVFLILRLRRNLDAVSNLFGLSVDLGWRRWEVRSKVYFGRFCERYR